MQTTKTDAIVSKVACYYHKKYEEEYGCILSFCSTDNDKEFILSIDMGGKYRRIPIPQEFEYKDIFLILDDKDPLPDSRFNFSIEGLVKFKDILKVYKSLLKQGLVSKVVKG